MVYCSFRNAYLLARYLLFSSWQSDCRSSYCLAFILFQVCSSSLSYRVILPLVPQYEMVASVVFRIEILLQLASLLSLGTLCAPAYVSAYFRDTLRWQTTRFTSLCHPTLHLTAKAESHGVGYTSVVSSLWGWLFGHNPPCSITSTLVKPKLVTSINVVKQTDFILSIKCRSNRVVYCLIALIYFEQMSKSMDLLQLSFPTH
jgi:hypothetical protein